MRLAFTALLSCLFMAFPAAAQSASPSVFVFIMDEFSGTSLEDSKGRIDRFRFPNLASISKSATWYPMASTSSDMTFRAVPSIWSGLALDRAGESEQTLFRLLENDYRLVQFEGVGPVQKLCASCPAPPRPSDRLDGIPVRGQDSQAESIRSTLGAIRDLKEPDARPLLWTTHVIAPHAPYRFLPSGHQVPLSPHMQNPGVTESKRWSSERWPVTLSRQRFLYQAGFTDRLIGKLRDNLKAAKAWEEAMVIIVADHGSSWSPGTHRRYVEPESFAQVANVPLLIKYPGQSEGKVDRGSAQLIDIAPTVAGVLGRSLSWSSPGLDLRGIRPGREVSLFTADRREWVTRSFKSFTSQRRASVKSWNRLFPRGPARAWIGPQPNLRGVSVKSFRRYRSSASARLDMPERFRSVKPRGGWLPAVLGAELFGLPAGSPVAVSVNGRVVASGLSYTANDGSIRVNLPLPPGVVRQGRNRVELWSISQGLRLISSAA